MPISCALHANSCAALADSDSANISAAALLKAVSLLFCFVDDQCTGAPFSENIIPVVDFVVNDLSPA